MLTQDRSAERLAHSCASMLQEMLLREVENHPLLRGSCEVTLERTPMTMHMSGPGFAASRPYIVYRLLVTPGEGIKSRVNSDFENSLLTVEAEFDGRSHWFRVRRALDFSGERSYMGNELPQGVKYVCELVRSIH